ncbi:hypothetical protein LTS18_009766, partial [Coniosporium uncinatum]
MFKPTPSLQRSVRRLALTTKQGPKDYYKGTRTGSMGRHTKYGTYKIEWNKVRTYVYPENMAEFKLTPFVATRVEIVKGNFEGHPEGPLSGEFYLSKWKSQN